ncbi:CPBP family intramembrane glutamic endopeptidase [Brevundimonas sp.]|uniref:CPBP family intramembrane glutamic endopeptidase n=1 Tax=Brevundimonas sp. TaxID=1871086 RepID=UPI0025C18FD4|nr:CPBP family intramembrane glutamic endopeptidase [Brevundimonas sp.]
MATAAQSAAEIIAAFGGLFFASAILGALVAPNAVEWLQTPLLALAMWGAVLVGGLFLRLRRSSYRQLGLARPASWTRTLVLAVIAAVGANLGALALGIVIQATTDWPPLDLTYIRLSLEGNTAAYLVWMVLVVWGSAAVGEELFARGFVMDRLTVLFGGSRVAIAAAVLVQALLFGLLHAIQGPTGVLITAFVGVVLAITYYASGRNLWAPIIAHGLMDTYGLTLIFLGLPLPGHLN